MWSKHNNWNKITPRKLDIGFTKIKSMFNYIEL